MVTNDLTIPTPFPPEHIRERVQWMYDAGIDPRELSGRVITVAGYKGGIGKTTEAIELAYLLGAVLLDFEWDMGSASVALGYRPDQRVRSILLEALAHDRAPRVINGGKWRPDFVPGHTEFEAQQPTADKTADVVERWATHWGNTRQCATVIDTHPGGSPSTLGAIAASHVTIAPAVLAEKQMTALEGMLDELAGYPVLIIPTMVSTAPPARYLDWLERMARDADVQVGPVISSYRKVPTRARRMAISAAGRRTPLWAQPMVAELLKVAKAVVEYVRSTG